MSGSALPSSPTRGRYPLHVSRSINERLPGTSSPRHGHSHSTHHHHEHHHLTRHISSNLHRGDRTRDGRNGRAAAVFSQAASVAAQVAPRGSLEAARYNESATPATTLSPDPSRRGSVMVPAGVEADGVVGGGAVPLTREEELRRERARAEARTAGLKKALLDLAAFSTTTNRRLDETYYIVLQKLTALQNTILALKELAQASATTHAGFIAESHGVVAEAQAQLDAFGDFSAQQARVEALQGRVHDGRDRITALGARVDSVRRRVERWERADREWQERTRRRLKIVWGFVMVLGALLAALYWGAGAFVDDLPAVEVGDVARRIGEEVARVGAGAGVGVGKAGDDDDGGNGTAPALDFGDGGAGAAGEEVFRALDEL